MHTTTVRFAPQTWGELKAICEREGIATAQYIREATIARLAQNNQLPQVARQDNELVELRGRVDRLERALRGWGSPRRS